MMNWYLLKYCSDFSDEFDIHGCCILNEEELCNLKAAVHKYFEKYGESEFWFGTNESIEYGSEDQLWADFEISLLDPEQKKTLEAYGFNRWGNMPDIHNFTIWED